MSPYIKYIRKKYIRLINHLPYQIFLLSPRRPEEEGNDTEDLEEEGEENGKEEGKKRREAKKEQQEKARIEKMVKELDQFRKLLQNRNWCESKYTKLIFRRSIEHLPKFKMEYLSEEAEVGFSKIRKGIKLMEQFLSQNEMEQLATDLCKLAAKTGKITVGEHYNPKTSGQEDILAQLKRLFGEKSAQNKSLGTLLAELPFLVFLLVAGADGNIDKKERTQFVAIIRDWEWCYSDCAQTAFANAAYSFDDFFKMYLRGKLKKEIRQVERTLKLAENIFAKKEVDLLKVDLSRLSTEIAKASGGFGGFGSISKEEKAVIAKLESYFGDLSHVDIPVRSKKDITEKFILDTEQTPGGHKNAENAQQSTAQPDPASSRASQNAARSNVGNGTGNQAGKAASAAIDSRERERVQISEIDAVVHAGDTNLEAEVLNLSKKSVCCQIEFPDEYVDVIGDVRLSLLIFDEPENIEIRYVRCKTLRGDILDWDKNSLPTAVKIAWMFVLLPEEDQKHLDRIVDRSLAAEH